MWTVSNNLVLCYKIHIQNHCKNIYRDDHPFTHFPSRYNRMRSDVSIFKAYQVDFSRKNSCIVEMKDGGDIRGCVENDSYDLTDVSRLLTRWKLHLKHSRFAIEAPLFCADRLGASRSFCGIDDAMEEAVVRDLVSDASVMGPLSAFGEDGAPRTYRTVSLFLLPPVWRPSEDCISARRICRMDRAEEASG